MEGFWAFVFSPAGIGAYLVFWAVKLSAGAWVLRQVTMRLPEAVTDWLQRNIRMPAFAPRKSAAGPRDMK